MSNTHYDTPTRAKARGIVQYLDARGLLGKGCHTKKNIFPFCGVSRRAGYRILAGRDPPSPTPRRTRASILKAQNAQEDTCHEEEANYRTFHNDIRLPKPRDRKRAYSEVNIDDIEHLMYEEPYESRRMGWQSLADAADVEPHHE